MDARTTSIVARPAVVRPCVHPCHKPHTTAHTAFPHHHLHKPPTPNNNRLVASRRSCLLLVLLDSSGPWCQHATCERSSCMHRRLREAAAAAALMTATAAMGAAAQRRRQAATQRAHWRRMTATAAVIVELGCRLYPCRGCRMCWLLPLTLPTCCAAAACFDGFSGCCGVGPLPVQQRLAPVGSVRESVCEFTLRCWRVLSVRACECTNTPSKPSRALSKCVKRLRVLLGG